MKLAERSTVYGYKHRIFYSFSVGRSIGLLDNLKENIMKVSKKREHWKEMIREAIDIKRKMLRKQKYGANSIYASRRRRTSSRSIKSKQAS